MLKKTFETDERNIKKSNPGTEPVGSAKVELPAGMVRITFGSQNGGAIFEELINTSTKAFQRLEHTCRNMSSMVTPISLMGSLKTADLSLANSLNLNIKTLGEDFVVETLGVVDTGADVGVGDKVIRQK